MGRRYYRSIVTVGVLSGTTASVPPQYREGSLRAELRAVPRSVLPLELFLPLFFFKRYFRSCTASVPLQYRKGPFRAELRPVPRPVLPLQLILLFFSLKRYFRSGTGPVPLRYRRQLHTGGTWPGTWTGTSTSSGTTAGVGGTTAQY